MSGLVLPSSFNPSSLVRVQVLLAKLALQRVRKEPKEVLHMEQPVEQVAKRVS